mgnify:FL=1
MVAVVPHISESWHGARAVVGRASEEQASEENVPAPVEGEIEPSNDSPEHGENAEKE